MVAENRDSELGSLGSSSSCELHSILGKLPYCKPHLLAHICHAILALEEETGSFQVPGLSEPHSETLSQKNKKLARRW